MAETRKITIEITSVDKKPKTEIEKSQNESNAEGLGGLDSNEKENGLLEGSKSVVINQAYSKMKSLVINNVDYAINRHFNLTDDYIGQRTYNIAKSIIGKGKDFATSIAAGFAVGGPVGAAVSAAFSVVSTGIEVWKNYDQQNIMLKQMDTQLEYSRQRAGFSLTSGSIGENK